MLILIIETSTEKGCLVLAENGTPLASQNLRGGPELSKSLAFEVKNLIGSRTPDLIAVGNGPGSYTGIRVAAAMGKALAYGWQIPLIGFCSLKAFGPKPVLIDARGGGFYALLDQEPVRISPSELPHLTHFSSPHPDLIQKRLPFPAIGQETEPLPSHLAEMIYQQFLEEGITPFELNYASCP